MNNTIIFGAGVGIGLMIGWFGSKKYHESKLDKELNDMKEYYEKKKEPEKVTERPSESVRRPQKPSLEELRRKYVSEDEKPDTELYFTHPADSDEDDDIDGYSKEEWDSIGYEQEIDAKKRAKMAPMVIDVDEYGEYPNFDASELIYHSRDDSLTDEEGNEIEDRGSLLGECMEGFITDDEEDLFVRNYRLATDYHVHKV